MNPKPFAGETCLSQHVSQLFAGLMGAVRHGCRKYPATSRASFPVHPGPLVHALVALMQPVSGQCHQPAKVIPVHKMPGGAEDVRPQDGSVSYGLFHGSGSARGRALRHGPPCVGKFLRLDGQEVAYNLPGTCTQGRP